MNLTELLDQTARRWPEKAALIDGNRIVSYAELVEQTAAFASQLRTLRLPPGCRVGLCCPNSVEYVALTFALWRIGAIVVPIPMECAKQEMLDLAATMQIEAILSQKSLGQSLALSAECFFTRLTPDLRADNHGLNVAFIRFTSGTTNVRKGVVLTHETIRDRIAAANEALRVGPQDTVMWCLPMAHHFLITIVLYLSQGATIVLAPLVLARSYLEAVNRWRGTVLYAAPFHYALLARDNSGADLSSVRRAVSTTCALPEAVAKDFFARFQQPLTQGLGIMELGLVSLNTADPQQRWNSVGRPLEGFRVRILAPDENGNGEVAVSGPGMFDAYAAPWISRDQAASDGWFKTGDSGRLDSEGFLFLAGHQAAIINLAGRKVFPEEIEAVLNRHPAVRESRAYGRAHPHLGKVVKPEVVLANPGADLESVRKHCRASLSSFKIPSRLHVVNGLTPTSHTGKLRRAAPVTQHG